ncbi:P-loop containing nucleoside triphosphate hydrolase protein [Phyllosticta citrichinensis]|uniref:P-loop containing nucleoside triphosphate hydrolase protein n=1 Tax=Phyllosticta citrichinensis TaxID=1130410 RepID=A0ABR1XXA9_9PEZI
MPLLRASSQPYTAHNSNNDQSSALPFVIVSTMVVSESFQAVLRADDYTEVLDTTSHLQSFGIGDDVPPLQIIVCGDKSSGKSSDLEALSGIKFPTGENGCTRFAIEVVLRRGTRQSTDVAIIPGPSRNPQERRRLYLFQARDVQVENLTLLVESAKAFIDAGVEGRAFSDDILRVEICHPKNPHLTLIDLPGLIEEGNDYESTSNAKFVMSINRRFMEDPRSVILTVISAENVHANQVVTELAREIDPQRKRSLGIINKLDMLLDADPKKIRRFLSLPTWKETWQMRWQFLTGGGISLPPGSEGRTTKERCIFNHSNWKSLPPGSNGIDALRSRVAAMLTDQIMDDLPTLICDIRSGIADCETKLRRLGDPRVTIQDQKFHLIKASQKFSTLVTSAINGTYADHADFFNDALTARGAHKRLRALIHDLLWGFAEEMRTHGEFEKIGDEAPNPPERTPSNWISREKYLEYVRDLNRRSNGCGLTGTFNPQVVGDLFRRQSQPWSRIIGNSVDCILQAVRNFFDLTLDYSMDTKAGEAVMRRIINPAMEIWTANLQDKVEEIMAPHLRGHPITYNLNFTDTIQKSRREMSKQQASSVSPSLREALDSRPLTEDQFEVFSERIREELRAHIDLYSCEEAVDCMKAYYEVTMKTVIDNIAVLAIEQCLLGNLAHVFSPEKVFGLDEETVADIAAESKELREERAATADKLKALKKALQTLTRLTHHRRIDMQSESPLEHKEMFLRKDTQSEVGKEAQIKQELQEEEAKSVCKDDSSSTDIPAALTPELEQDSVPDIPRNKYQDWKKELIKGGRWIQVSKSQPAVESADEVAEEPADEVAEEPVVEPMAADTACQVDDSCGGCRNLSSKKKDRKVKGGKKGVAVSDDSMSFGLFD